MMSVAPETSDIVVSSEEYLGRTIFPRVVGGIKVGAYLLITFDGQSYEELEPTIEAAAELLIENGAIDVLLADTPAKKKDAWAARSSFLEGIIEQTNLLDECDVVVPASKIAEFIEYVNEMRKRTDIGVKSFGHAGDGNLHIYTCSNDTDKEAFVTKVDAFMEEIYAKATELGGEVSGEHGIGSGKIKYLEKSIDRKSTRLYSRHIQKDRMPASA